MSRENTMCFICQLNYDEDGFSEMERDDDLTRILRKVFDDKNICNNCNGWFSYSKCMFCNCVIKSKKSWSSISCDDHAYLLFKSPKIIRRLMLINEHVMAYDAGPLSKYLEPDGLSKKLDTVTLALKHIVAEIDKKDLVKTMEEISKG